VEQLLAVHSLQIRLPSVRHPLLYHTPDTNSATEQDQRQQSAFPNPFLKLIMHVMRLLSIICSVLLQAYAAGNQNRTGQPESASTKRLF
jgi:hypothetical protein